MASLLGYELVRGRPPQALQVRDEHGCRKGPTVVLRTVIFPGVVVENHRDGGDAFNEADEPNQARLALNRSATQVEGVRAWGEAVSVVPKSRTLFPLNCHKASFHALTVCRLVLSRVATCAHVAFRYRGVFLDFADVVQISQESK